MSFNSVFNWIISNNPYNPYNTNYTSSIIESIIQSNLMKNKFTQLFIIIISNIIRYHLDGTLAYLLGPTNYIMHIMCSIFLFYTIGVITFIVSKFDYEIKGLIKYLTANYHDNLKLWRRILIVFTCLYILLLTFIVDITSALIQISIFEYLVCFCVIEIIEEKYIIKLYTTISNKQKSRSRTTSLNSTTSQNQLAYEIDPDHISYEGEGEEDDD